MADSPSPVPESGTETNSDIVERLRSVADDQRAEFMACGNEFSYLGMTGGLLRNAADRMEGLIARAESAEASARSARAEADSMFENELRWHDEAVAYCDAIFEWADARKAMTDAEVTTDVRINPEANAAWRRLAKAEDRLVAIRSLKTALKGDGEGTR